LDDSNAPWHAHIYYTADGRSRAQALRAQLIALKESGQLRSLVFVGELRDHRVGPHPVPQFEIHFSAALVPTIDRQIRESGLTALAHPLTQDDLADHTQLGRWIGEPIALDLTVLDPPGVNQGIARFGKTDF
jgi:aromatic ring-cleaving dioxygenase